jgi:ElaB/YqjD/DUF883 family membrane-anchored ribosome-binding protein
MAEPQLAADTPLSVDQASGLLSSLTTEVEPDEVVAADTESEAEPTADDEAAPEEASGDDEEAQAEDPEEPAIPAPRSWAAEDRAVFATLPREAQQVIAARESERDSSTQKAVQEASEARKKAEAEIQGVTQLRAASTEVFNRAAQVFRGKWDNVDWVAWAQTDPAAYTAGKAQFDAEQGELARLQAVSQAQMQIEQRAFQERKLTELREVLPEALDPVKGSALVKSIEDYIIGNGYSRDILPTLDAKTISTVNKARLWDELQARAKQKQPASKQTAVRPTASAPQRTPQRAAAEAVNRFRQTGSVDDAVAALTARS